MINRDDMLELTRRMTPSRTCFTRAAGAYMTADGEIDDTFNIHFLKLSSSEQAKNLSLAKQIPFARTNDRLREYAFPERAMRPGGMWQLLMALRGCGLKDDMLMELLYEQIGTAFTSEEPYAVRVYSGSYDVPVRGTDGEWLEGSETVYDFIICAVCPLAGEYEPSDPVCGFLFPAFSDRCADTGAIDFYQKQPGGSQEDLLKRLLGKQ